MVSDNDGPRRGEPRGGPLEAVVTEGSGEGLVEEPFAGFGSEKDEVAAGGESREVGEVGGEVAVAAFDVDGTGLVEAYGVASYQVGQIDLAGVGQTEGFDVVGPEKLAGGPGKDFFAGVFVEAGLVSEEADDGAYGAPEVVDRQAGGFADAAQFA